MEHCADPREFSPAALEHARSPRGYGPLKDFNGRARITGPCGDTMEFWVKVEDEQVEAVSFVTDGCAPSLASGSMAVELAAGKPLLEAAVLRQRDILKALGGLPPEVEHCALLAAETLQAACLDSIRRRDGLPAPPPDPGQEEAGEGRAPKGISRVKRTVAVLSGKGGTGKSAVAAGIAAALAEIGRRVGLLDADFNSPALPVMLGLERKGIPNRGPALLPARAGALKVLSLGLLPGDPAGTPAWDEAERRQFLERFLHDGEWGNLDFLVIDCPPGPAGVLSALRELVGAGLEALVVTTPQRLSAEAAREAILLCRREGIAVTGVIENMREFACPGCGQTTRVFRSGGGRKLSDTLKVPFLGSIPLDPAIVECGDRGRNFLEENPESPAAAAFKEIAARLAERRGG